jgi:hypothetical protein
MMFAILLHNVGAFAFLAGVFSSLGVFPFFVLPPEASILGSINDFLSVLPTLTLLPVFLAYLIVLGWVAARLGTPLSAGALAAILVGGLAAPIRSFWFNSLLRSGTLRVPAFTKRESERCPREARV